MGRGPRAGKGFVDFGVAAMPDDMVSHAQAAATPLAASRPRAPLAGTIRVPGDKSISHRALMLGGLAVGRTEIAGLLEGEDVLCTAAAMRALGAGVERRADGRWLVDGVGLGGLAEPADMIDLGNSGTAARLLLGILATHPITSFVTGDASLRSRPMQRVTDPLSRFGAKFTTREGGRLPLAVTGAASPAPLEYTLPVPSAQVKSAVLLAGLNTPGETTVIEPQPTRDHTERMLGHFGATVRVEPLDGGGKRVTIVGCPELLAAPIAVPADISSAAFALVAGLIVPGSEVTIEAVGLNPSRTGLLLCLKEMGADIAYLNERVEGGEPVADLRCFAAPLRGTEIAGALTVRAIDELPLIAVLAAHADGPTEIRDAAELRVKESDRIAATAALLRAFGVEVEERPDGLRIAGRPARFRPAIVDSHGDHRIAMSAAVCALAVDGETCIDDTANIATSFPTFQSALSQLGAQLS